MEAMTARQSWSDDRIDGLERKVDEGFRHVDQRFEQIDQRFEQVDKRFEQVDKRFEEVGQRLGRVEQQMDDMRAEMNAGFKHLGDRLDSFHHTMLLFSGGLVAALASAVIGMIAIQL
jgi:DNA anti-recombination protein RmuC